MVLILLLLPSLVAAEPIKYNNGSYYSETALIQDMVRDFANLFDEARIVRDSDNSLQDLIKTAPKVSWKAAQSWQLSKFGNCAKGAPPMCFARQVHQQRECNKRNGLSPDANPGVYTLTGGKCAGMAGLICEETRWYCNKVYLGLKKDGSTTWKLTSRNDEIQSALQAARKKYPDVVLEIRGEINPKGFSELVYYVGRDTPPGP